MTSYLYDVQTGNGTLVCLSLFLYQGEGVRDLTSFGNAKFEVKNFSLYLALWTLFPQVGGGGCLGPNFLWSCQI